MRPLTSIHHFSLQFEIAFEFPELAQKCLFQFLKSVNSTQPSLHPVPLLDPPPLRSRNPDSVVRVWTQNLRQLSNFKRNLSISILLCPNLNVEGGGCSGNCGFHWFGGSGRRSIGIIAFNGTLEMAWYKVLTFVRVESKGLSTAAQCMSLMYVLSRPSGVGSNGLGFDVAGSCLSEPTCPSSVLPSFRPAATTSHPTIWLTLSHLGLWPS